MLSDFESSGRSVGREHHQILNFLIVDFHDRETNFEVALWSLELVDSGEDLVTCDGHDTLVCSIPDLREYQRPTNSTME